MCTLVTSSAYIHVFFPGCLSLRSKSDDNHQQMLRKIVQHPNPMTNFFCLNVWYVDPWNGRMIFNRTKYMKCFRYVCFLRLHKTHSFDTKKAYFCVSAVQMKRKATGQMKSSFLIFLFASSIIMYPCFVHTTDYLLDINAVWYYNLLNFFVQWSFTKFKRRQI